MDKTKSKLAAFFDSNEDEASFPQKAVDTSKVSQFAMGTVRKSRREKEKELAEAKKREEEESAARAYAEFLETFEGEGRGKTGSTFVKSSSESNVAYIPAYMQSANSSMRSRPFDEPPSPPPAVPKPKGKRAMDMFLEEIKRQDHDLQFGYSQTNMQYREQAQREAKYARHAHGRSVTALAAYEGQSGSKDRGDPETSNIFVANLPPHVTEQTLGQFFAKVGPVGSVKIMWPRGDATVGPGADMTASRRSRNTGLSGFVSFMKRKDAEAALREFDGSDWGGSILRVGWSKAVPMATKPLYVASSSRSRNRDHSSSRSRSRSRDRRRSHSRDRRYSRRSRSRSWDRSRSRSRRRSYSRYSGSRSRSPRRRYRSRSPQDAQEEIVTDTFIRAVAAEIKGHGLKYEKSLREREQNNPKYAFMNNKYHRRHAFYKGLLESDRTMEPEFDDEGYSSLYSTDSAEESERERTRKTILGRLARRRFEAMLRALTGKRGELARCMAFCLEHAEAATEVSDIIVASLLVDGTPVPRKVARLHLICDILHNSAASVPSAWKFRQEFQSRLGIVFDHLANIYHSFPGRITAETFKKQITAVVDIWEDWIVFPPEFTTELRQRLEGATVESVPKVEEVPSHEHVQDTSYSLRFKSSSFQPAPMGEASGISQDPVDRIPTDDVDGEPVDDVDGLPLNDDVDGVPMNEDDIDGEPMPDPSNLDDMDDIDGVPL